MAPARARDACLVHYVDAPRVRSVRKRMASPEHIRRLAETFRAMGDGTRIRIILALSLDEFCVCDLAALLELTSPAVSHHLRILRALRLVKVRRRGRMAYYSLDDAHIERLFRMGLEHVEEG